MANYATLKAAINAVIRANGNKEITGTVLNETLTAMVNSLGANYQFAGMATPSTNPGTPDQKVFYLAGQAGTYTNFNNIILPDGVSVLKWNGSWSSDTVVAVDGVFDISAYKATGGTLATFADLSAALDGGNNIPSALRKGGMSVKFVKSSDNKYVQYRLASTTWSTDIHDWTSEDPYFIDKIMQEVNEAIDEHTPIEIIGDVTNAPDEEDLTSVNVGGTDVLKFKDKAYNQLTYSGMGRKILRKNIVNGVNTLTQSMINQPNTIYAIQYDFDLSGGEVTIPENCILKFEGGSLSNGTVVSNKTKCINISTDVFRCNLVGWFYSINNIRLSNKSFNEHNGSIEILCPVVAWSNTDVTTWANNMVYNDIARGQIVVHVVYDSETNECKYSDDESALLNPITLFNIINSRGIEIHSVKFHKLNLSDSGTSEELLAYKNFVKEVITLYEGHTSHLESVFISNEEPNKTAEGSNWNDVHIELCEWLHNKNYKVGISTYLPTTTFANISQSLLNNLDLVGLNYYPTISFIRTATQFSYVPKMTDLVTREIGYLLLPMLEKVSMEKIAITECGVSNGNAGLEDPSDWTRDKHGIDESGKLRAIFYATTIKAAKMIGIKLFSPWYCENSMQQSIVGHVFEEEQF